jgi:hypothetical protein
MMTCTYPVLLHLHLHATARFTGVNMLSQRSTLTFTLSVLLVTVCSLVSTASFTCDSTILLLLLLITIPDAVQPVAVVAVRTYVTVLALALLQLLVLPVALVSTHTAVIVVSAIP